MERRLVPVYPSAILLGLCVFSAALCWFPMIIDPSMDLPYWAPSACVAVSAALSAALYRQLWRRYWAGCIFGTFAGLCIAFAIWYPKDGIAASFIPLAVIADTIVVALVSLISSFVGSRLPAVGTGLDKVFLVVLVVIASFGPVCLALTPSVVADRVERNERLAAERVASLQRAVERVAAVNPAGVCDGSIVKRSYEGRVFSDEDWRRITGNYVKQDGYMFMINCEQQGGYTIDAAPARSYGEDGRRDFCVDETGKTGCGMWFNRARYACVPCKP